MEHLIIVLSISEVGGQIWTLIGCLSGAHESAWTGDTVGVWLVYADEPYEDSDVLSDLCTLQTPSLTAQNSPASEILPNEDIYHSRVCSQYGQFWWLEGSLLGHC
jgi:hypothetical protein